MQKRIQTSAFAFFISLSLLAWGKTADYADEPPIFFLPFSEALVCALLAFLFLKIGGFIHKDFEDEKGNTNGCVSFIVVLCMLAALIFAFMGWYVVWVLVGIIAFYGSKK